MNNNILITGTSKGIGNYLAQNLSRDYNVFGISRTKSIGEVSFAQHCVNLTNFEQFNIFCEKLEKKDIKFSSIILNAGVGFFGTFENISAQKYEEMLNVNLLSPILIVQKLLPFLEEGGKIIFIGSISAKKFLKYGAVYQATKFGLRGFAGALKNELGNRVHIINPRLVKTDFHKQSQIEIDFSPERITSLESILEVVENILEGKEKRFEIDL